MGDFPFIAGLLGLASKPQYIDILKKRTEPVRTLSLRPVTLGDAFQYPLNNYRSPRTRSLAFSGAPFTYHKLLSADVSPVFP